MVDASGQPEDFLSSGLTAEEAAQLWDLPEGMRLFEYLGGLSAPLRLADLPGHLSSLGFPDHLPPFVVAPGFSYLSASILYQSQRVGNIYLGKKKAGEGFTEADEETMVLFASQAAMALSIARRYREEQRVRNDLKTLINIAPVGVIVWDVGTGLPVSFNREAKRILNGLRNPDQSPEELLQVLTFRRGDGRESLWDRFSWPRR